MKDVLPFTAETSPDGHLVIGGLDAVDLAERFGTPLIVFDRATFEARARTYASALDPAQVHYAGKSFCCVAICQLVDGLGLSLDVCTGGELATALAASFPPSRITFHGNNKSEAELKAAQEAGVGRVVVDSFDEIDRLAACGVRTKLMIRVTPGVEAHTHEFVQTGQEDSKFGFSLHDGIALEAIKRASEVPGCDLAGLHAHIGSQIFELAAFDLAIDRLAELAAEAKSAHSFEVRELNVGGGLGIAHTRDEMTPDPAEAVARMTQAIDKSFSSRGLTIPRIFVEPGRSIVGPSAVTLYRIGTVKRIPGVRTYVSMDGGMSDNMGPKGQLFAQTDRVYVSVDGGMSDNLRPALYGARYEAFLANRMDTLVELWTSIAGKHCESGDILIKDVQLPADVTTGDLLCVPATGAYTYSMANNYNRVPRPPVVMVDNGTATVIVERETQADMYRLDRRLDGSRVH